MSDDTDAMKLVEALSARFREDVVVPDGLDGLSSLTAIASRGSQRTFTSEPIDPKVLRLLCAVALSSPTKSDLQQRDIVIVEDAETRAALNALVAGQGWVSGAPALLLFCGNNRRQRQIHDWRDHPFENDHFDAAFNASVDAGIALSAFVIAAEAIGLGCCPISAVRNHAQEVSDLLELPDHVFPVAGLAVGKPIGEKTVSMRLPLGVTVHTDRFDETGLREAVDAYDADREASQPYTVQRATELFGCAPRYGWSEDKTRQYAQPERADFGAFMRRRGFDLT